jgi:hypothetical protein
MSHVVKKVPKGNGTLPKALAESWAKIGYGLGAVGLVAFLAGFLLTPAAERGRFGAAYLTGFMFTTTIGVGALFFVVIQHLTKAGWSVAPRRIMEWLSQGLTASAGLFVPIVLMSQDIWHHWMGPHAAHDPILLKKQAYLNPTFFYIRAVIFLLTWALLAAWFYKQSRDQDTSGDRRLSAKRESAAAPAIFALGITISFAGFDWVMSLDPHWYSTIFGVYIFAGSLVSSMAVLALCIIRLRKHNVGGDLLTVEHMHDVGKFLFGFTVFWAYIGFSQFMLIWYANIPEETGWFKERFAGSWTGGSWGTLAAILLFGHFVIPFFGLLSRHIKRRRPTLAFWASWQLVMIYLDMYWLVMPSLHKGVAAVPGNHATALPFSLMDLCCAVGILGIYIAGASLRAKNLNLMPTNDPRLPKSLAFTNI